MELTVRTSAGAYPVLVKRGILQNTRDHLPITGKALIVTDSGVPAQYAKTVAAQCKAPFVVTVREGEPTKSMDSYRFLLQKMVDYGFTRTDCVIAVGGGVVGDLAGFAAATYMRGIDFYNIPTTVLSQVDSSIGGKVAIDFGGYKNSVGAFYPPKAVLIDPETLKTLPERQIANGLAESVKMAATCDRELFAMIESGKAEIDEIILRSLQIKQRVVEEDEKEAGLRRILNFGHTLAHAIEAENALQNLYHGECVAIGMIPMCSDKVRPRLVAVLRKLHLPTKAECDIEVLIEACRHDKKASGDQISVIFVNEIGSYEIKTMPFSEYETRIREALA